ncbi:hypothetical protein BDV36DRAFT_286879 [Aspergillus pseudocaelatus]|uniref:C2H2 finger domain protein n=1 Tax=Aspergillus pseudocaelatus TaxID=1825620 RepID=A0ABQ6W8X8_9EURO|nr:hypothetical protein BDV36DRAFT_286879 [Aspergillus pseudocaelatus]
MARHPRTYAGRSSDDDETASSVSFRLDSDDAVGVDLQTDVTDVTDSDVPPSTRRRDKGRPCQNRSMQRSLGEKSHKSEKGSPSLSRLATDSDCSSSGDDVNVDTRHSRRPEQRWSQKKFRKPAALSGAPTRNNDSNTSSSDNDCSGSGFDSDTDTDPDIDSDGELSSDSDDDSYADGTRRNITRMDERWERYYRKRNKRYRALPDSLWANPASALREARKKELTLFLRWCLHLRRGKNGRKLKGIKKFKSLDTDWKLFLCHYEKVTGEPIDDALGRRMRKSIRRIVREHDLDTDEKEKTPIFIEDVVSLQETTLRTIEKRFDLGLQHMQQCLYPLIACFTVNQINAMRCLQYQHLQCSTQRDPHGGPPRILLEIKYKFAKKYMGITQANTFPLPEIIYNPSLMLSPHTFLLGILFHDDTFRAPGIKSMEDLRRLCVEDGRQQMEVPLKWDKAKYYVFCKVKCVRDKIQIYRDQPISQSTLSRQLKIFGEIAGFNTILNESGLVSDAKQNLIIKHADIRMFLNHYLPRRINTDMQALMRGLKPDSAMMRAVTRIGRWIDRRRPRELTDAQKATVEHDPELQKAIRKRDAFSKKLQRSQKKTDRKLDKLDKLKRGVTNTRNRLLYVLRQRMREEFDKEQVVLDIERQLAGTTILDEEAKEQLQIEEQLLPQQIYLVGKLMTWPIFLSVEAEWQRRNEATEAVRLYCDVLEGGPRRGRRPNGLLPREEVIVPTESSLPIPSPSRHEIALQEAGEDIRTAAKPRACFQCYGNPAGCGNRCLKQYSRHKGLLRHFRAVYLDDRHCNYCNEPVDNEMYWRRHTVDNHRLNVRYLEDYPHDL